MLGEITESLPQPHLSTICKSARDAIFGLPAMTEPILCVQMPNFTAMLLAVLFSLRAAPVSIIILNDRLGPATLHWNDPPSAKPKGFNVIH